MLSSICDVIKIILLLQMEPEETDLPDLESVTHVCCTLMSSSRD